MDQKLLLGKTAIVTGATSGIGKAIFFAFLRSGAKVIGLGTNPEKIAKIQEEIRAEGREQNSFIEPCDVSSKEAVDSFFAKLPSEFLHLDILVNNAGITKDGLLLRMSLDDWEKVLDTNLRSCFLMSQHAAKLMIKARSGRIINISSVVGLIGNPGQTNYAASKAGIIGFSRSLAKELASRNILVNCIAPGFIETGMTAALGDEKNKEAAHHIPLGRMGSPEDVAKSALFLASDLSTYITGQVLVVDGGLSIGF
jgi:3-oxoacyl-[acyl-carrier protein] reductase